MSLLDHEEYYEKSERARLQCVIGAIAIGLIGDNEEEQNAHEAGWHAAIAYMAMNGLIKDTLEC